MPLTFAHPALILPLTHLPKRYVSVTGLIAGSIAPDFEKFARLQAGLQADRAYSHTWAGIFWVNLPVALLLSFVFHLIVRDPLRRNLPVFWQKRFHRLGLVNWPQLFKKRYGIIIFSILLGAGSHLFWDSFTNKNGYFLQYIPFLTDYTRVFKKAIPHFVLAHQLSSVVGGLVVLYAILKLPAAAPVKPNEAAAKYWFTFALIAGLLILMQLLLDLCFERVDSNIAINVITAGLLSLTITSFSFRKKWE